MTYAVAAKLLFSHHANFIAMQDHVYKLLYLLNHHKNMSFSDLLALYQSHDYAEEDFRDAIEYLDEHHFLREEFPDSGLVFTITTRGETEYERETAKRHGSSAVS